MINVRMVCSGMMIFNTSLHNIKYASSLYVDTGYLANGSKG